MKAWSHIVSVQRFFYKSKPNLLSCHTDIGGVKYEEILKFCEGLTQTDMCFSIHIDNHSLIIYKEQ